MARSSKFRLYNIVRLLYNFKVFRRFFLNIKNLLNNLKFRTKKLGKKLDSNGEVYSGNYQSIVNLTKKQERWCESFVVLRRLVSKLKRFYGFKGIEGIESNR